MARRSDNAAFEFAATAPGLVGIAKLASESELLESKRRVEYRELPTRHFIGRCSSPRMPFQWTLNPYRGCEFGCRYCYARYAHEFMELRDWRQFEQQIFAKEWNEHTFRAELDAIPPGQTLCLGTATDPYQPAERRYGVTRKMVEVIASRRGLSLFVTTKSDLVARDADLFQQISRANRVQVSLTITTLDEQLARIVEPYAPRPSLRLQALRKLTEAGVRCGVLAHPIMPLINDGEDALDALASAAADAGATYFSAAAVFLKPCAQAAFFPMLEEHFPHLVRRYKERFSQAAYLKGSYPELLSKRVATLREKYKFDNRFHEYRPDLWPEDPQLHLFG